MKPESFEMLISEDSRGLVVCQPNGRIESTNSAACELLGQADWQLVGQTLDAVLERQHDPSSIQSWLASTGESAVVIVRNASPSRQLLLSKTKQSSPEAPSVLSLELLKKVILETPPDHRPADYLSLEQLSSRMGHELANLLTPMLGYLELVDLEPIDPEETKQVHRTMSQIGRRMLLHVQNMLELHRQGVARLSRLKLKEVVERALSAAGETGQLTPALVETEYPDVNIKIEGDLELLTHAITNVLVNASEANHEGGLIRITTHSSDRFAEILIDDSGVGISPKDIEWAFMPFTSTKSAGQGVGLGLYIARKILTSLGGDITLVPRPQRGTTAKIRIPLHPTV